MLFVSHSGGPTFIIGNFRLEYEYESEYEYDFSNRECVLKIITLQTLNIVPKAFTSTDQQQLEGEAVAVGK